MVYFNTKNLDKKITSVIKLNRKLQALDRWISENSDSPLHKFETFKIQYSAAIIERNIKVRVLSNLNVLNY